MELWTEHTPIERPWVLCLNFAKLTVLRRLTLRMEFSQVSTFERDPFLRALSTIASPLFCEFVIELDRPPVHFDRSPLEHWGRWGAIDRFLAGKLAQPGDFRFVIRANRLRDQETFQKHAVESFRLSARKGCIHFEMPGH